VALAALLQDHPRKILAILLAVLLGAGYFIRSAFRYEDTDGCTSGWPHHAVECGESMDMCSKFLLSRGQLVHAGDVLVTIDPTDFEIAMHQAQATFADALASAASSRFNVPITSVTTQSNLDSAGTAVVNAQAGLKAAEQNFESAKAALEQAEANSTKRPTRTLVRYEKLVAKEEISRSAV